jgi:ribonucleoside-diphosphate reductase alpha chain
MARLEFLPNSPTLMNAGRELQQLSACFVLPVEDSLESIFDTIKHQALIHQSGGGTGFSFSHLRPKGDVVHTTSGIASGPVSFMRVFNMATEVIKQGGTRRGANMGILRVDHPDILEFINAKQDSRELTNFNISVAITDAFMHAVEQTRDYPLVNPRTGRPVRRIKALEVFDRLAAAAWQNGEPGVIFVDTINAKSPTPHVGRIESTNPCGEQPLLAYESCTLGSVNLAKFVMRGSGARSRSTVDFERLGSVVHSAVRYLDNVLDMNQYPLPQIEDMTKANRKIGLGVMGFADLLIQLDIPYDTDEALSLGERVMRFVWEQARAASLALGKERGLFPNYKGSRLESEDVPLRNATLTTVAPTGTISIIADCSPGIEPLYGVSFVRTVMEDVRLTSVHTEFARRARAAGIYTPALARRVAANESIQDLTEIPADLRRLFVTAHDIPAEFHVQMQAAFQRYSDSGVSKTINLPASATQQDVAAAFLLAHRLGCKGLTVFRSGSREKQVMSCANVQYC